jgi:hypothetical protein
MIQSVIRCPFCRAAGETTDGVVAGAAEEGDEMRFGHRGVAQSADPLSCPEANQPLPCVPEIGEVAVPILP